MLELKASVILDLVAGQCHPRHIYERLILEPLREN